MASKKQNTLLNFFKPKEKQGKKNFMKILNEFNYKFYFRLYISHINVPTNDLDDPMSIVKNTDNLDDSLLMCDQSPKVNDLSKILKKIVLLIQ